MVVCACDPGEQFRRLMSRDRLDPEEARARIAAQWPIEEKVRRADHVIRTDGTFAETEAQVAEGLRGPVGAGVRLRQLVSVASVSFAGAMRSSTNVFHSWQCGHCQSSSVLR